MAPQPFLLIWCSLHTLTFQKFTTSITVNGENDIQVEHSEIEKYEYKNCKIIPINEAF